MRIALNSTKNWLFCPHCGKPLKEKEWEPEKFKEYYSITQRMGIEKISADPFVLNKPELVRGLQERHAVGNLFTTREAAEKHLAMIKCVDSQRELPESECSALYMDYSGSIKNTTYVRDGSELYMDILWRLGFAQPDTPEGRALLEKNIRENRSWFE